MLNHIFEFVIDFFTHLNLKKIFGAILIFVGLAIMGKTSGNVDSAVLYIFAGFIICSIGFVIIYHDIARDKISHGYDELKTLDKAFDRKVNEERKINSWHLHHEDKKISQENEKKS